MSQITFYEALGLGSGPTSSTPSLSEPHPLPSRIRHLSLFPPQYLRPQQTSSHSQMPARNPVLIPEHVYMAPSRRLDAILDRSSRQSQELAPWPATEVSETDYASSHDSGYDSEDTFDRMLDSFPAPPAIELATRPRSQSRDTFHHMLHEFPVPPAGLPLAVEFQPGNSDVAELKSWDWTDRSHLSGLTALEGAWDQTIPSREVLVSPENIAAFNEKTNNISMINRNTTNRNSGPMRTFFDDASIASPTLHSKRWTLTLPSEVKQKKRESTLEKVKVVAKQSAKKLDCFSSDDEDGSEGKGRQASTSTVSTIVSGIAEITDAVSMMRWRLYFSKGEERRKMKEANQT